MSDNKKISKLDSLSDAISEFAKKKRENAEPMPTFVPATPAPSQPAAREFVHSIEYNSPWWDAKMSLIGKMPSRVFDDVCALMEAYAAQQTAAFELKGWQDAIQSVRASLQQYPNVGGDIEIMQAVEKIVQEQSAAKDAEIERLHMDESPELAQVKSALATEYELRQAAEREREERDAWEAKSAEQSMEFSKLKRERDSLREALINIKAKSNNSLGLRIVVEINELAKAALKAGSEPTTGFAKGATVAPTPRSCRHCHKHIEGRYPDGTIIFCSYACYCLD